MMTHRVILTGFLAVLLSAYTTIRLDTIRAYPVAPRQGAQEVGFVKGNATFLEPSCSTWTKQEDGSYWRTCVDDNGHQYCEVSKNGQISRVKCSVT